MPLRKLLLLGIGLCAWSCGVGAHVKWFATYDLLCAPRSPSQIVFGAYFLFFCLFVALVMFAVAYVDRYLVSTRGMLFRHALALTESSQPYISTVLRIGVSIFFVAAASYGIVSDAGFFLTPELKTSERWVVPFHLAIALLALSPRTAFLAGIGIVALYGYAASEFCAAYLLITGMLSARVAALILLFFFVSTIYYFGILDAIGHSVIIVVLGLLTLCHNPLAAQLETHGLTTTAVAHTGFFFGTLILFIGIYCGGHYLSYRPYTGCAA